MMSDCKQVVDGLRDVAVFVIAAYTTYASSIDFYDATFRGPSQCSIAIALSLRQDTSTHAAQRVSR
jgi:hypothetical protein